MQGFFSSGRPSSPPGENAPKTAPLHPIHFADANDAEIAVNEEFLD
jgi:hypothetical protein